MRPRHLRKNKKDFSKTWRAVPGVGTTVWVGRGGGPGKKKGKSRYKKHEPHYPMTSPLTKNRGLGFLIRGKDEFAEAQGPFQSEKKSVHP